MAKRNILLLLLLTLTVLTGCEKKDSREDRKGLVDSVIRKEEQQIAVPEEKTNGWYLLGRQFYQGEAVQIWSANNAAGNVDIYLFREAGRKEELLAEVPKSYGNCKWFLDSEGHCILLPKMEGGMIRLDGDGKEAYHKTGKFIEDICQLSDGRILVIQWTKDSGRRLGELHCDTGAIDDLGAVKPEDDTGQFIGSGGNGLLMLDREGLWEVNLRNRERECIMAFGASYDPGISVEDFRILEDGRLEVLQSDGKLQRLELYDPVAGREIVVVRKPWFNSGIQQCANLFNQSNEDYYVYLEACPTGSDRITFGDQTLVEMAAGKGPDIICAPLLMEQIWDLIENGYVEDLAPRIKEAGIREEDYFPGAFSYPRDGDRIYGINLELRSNTCYISRAVLGARNVSDIGELAEALADYDGEGVFVGMNAQLILRYFLKGSEVLWGMLDWEQGSCRFDRELFAKILFISKKYADDGKNSRPALFEIGHNASYYDDDYYRQQYAEKDMVEIGYFFDSGRHGMNMTAGWLAIASTSPSKEGAWEFLQFLLSDQSQMIRSPHSDSFYPASKKCYDELARQAIAAGAYGPVGDSKMGTIAEHADLFEALGLAAYKEMFDPTRERVELVRRLLEDARTPALKTAPILDLICEDAEGYFAGSQSIEDVTATIQNRVQLYLDERR